MTHYISLQLVKEGMYSVYRIS